METAHRHSLKVLPLALSRRHAQRLRYYLMQQAIVYHLVPSRRRLQNTFVKYYPPPPSLWRLQLFYYFCGPGGIRRGSIFYVQILQLPMVSSTLLEEIYLITMVLHTNIFGV